MFSPYQFCFKIFVNGCNISISVLDSNGDIHTDSQYLGGQAISFLNQYRYQMITKQLLSQACSLLHNKMKDLNCDYVKLQCYYNDKLIINLYTGVDY